MISPGILRAAGVGIIIAGLAACATAPRIETETVPTADFSTRQTFAWQESMASYEPRAGSSDVQAVKEAIHDAVVAELGRKGYSEAAGRNPDFLVSFHLVVNVTKAEQLCTQRLLIFDSPQFHRQFDSYEICQRDPLMAGRTVRKGTLVVFVVDTATRNLLWQGVADGAAVSRRNPVRKLREAVAAMFIDFPGSAGERRAAS